MLILSSRNINQFGELEDWINVDYNNPAATIVPRRAWIPKGPKTNGCPTCTQHAQDRIPKTEARCEQQRANCLQSINRRIAQLTKAGYDVTYNESSNTDKCYSDYNNCISNAKKSRVTFE